MPAVGKRAREALAAGHFLLGECSSGVQPSPGRQGACDQEPQSPSLVWQLSADMQWLAAARSM